LEKFQSEMVATLFAKCRSRTRNLQTLIDLEGSRNWLGWFIDIELDTPIMEIFVPRDQTLAQVGFQARHELVAL
jgi:hypothetical protein